MRNKKHIGWVVAVLLAAQLACNAPTTMLDGTGTVTVPAPNQTLTALVLALTPGSPDPVSPTNTLPAVVTATRSGASEATQPAPTATPANRTPQPTVPNIRPRAQVEAKFLSAPPAIDGDWSEWKEITQEYPANSVVFGNENRTDDADLAGSFHIGWDERNLYIAVKVRDDRYVQNGAGEALYQGDSIEILLDTRLQEDYFYNRLSPDDFQLGISPGRPDPSGTKEVFLWLPAGVAGARTGAQIATQAETGGYRMEAAIPWHFFEVTPEEGTHMGFALSVSDNDNPDQNVQQSMVSNNAERRLTDPTTWGDLYFTR